MSCQRARNRILTPIVGILGVWVLPILPSTASAEDQYVAVDVHCCSVTTKVKLPAKGMRGLGGAQIGLATVTCKQFLTDDTLEYAGWPQSEGKGRTIDLRSVDRAPIQQEICTALGAPAAPAAPAADGSSTPRGILIPPCVQDALKEFLGNALNEPGLDLEINLGKVVVFKGTETSTKDEIYIDVTDADFRNPCALPFALFVGMEIHKMVLRRRLEIARRDHPDEVTDEDVKNATSPVVLDIYKGYLMRDLKGYYGLDGELDCCKVNLPSPMPPEPAPCVEVETFCKPRVGMLLRARP